MEAPKRAIIAEVIDPDGAMTRWLSPDLEALGWEVWRVPSVEAISRLGRDVYRATVRELVAHVAPDVLLVHPPYDDIDVATARAVRGRGGIVIGYAFDDALFWPQRTGSARAAWAAAIGARYDLYAVTDRTLAAEIAAAGAPAVWTPFATSTPSHEPTMALPEAVAQSIAGSAVLVGRAYARRVALVRALAAAHIPVCVFGVGWEDAGLDALPSVTVSGFVTREAMLAIYRHAGVVVTTGDWESHAVPMVKFRLLEAAMVGARQVAQDAPDLRSYFPAGEVPSYDDPASLISAVGQALADPAAARARGAAAAQRTHAEHSWRTRWPQLLSRVAGHAALRATDPGPVPASYVAMMSSLAHGAEQQGRERAAAAYFNAWLQAEPSSLDARAGASRATWSLGEFDRCRSHCDQALACADDLDPVTPATPQLGHQLGAGRGVVGLLDPRPELLARWFAASLALGEVAPAIARLASTDRPLLRRVAALLKPSDTSAEAAFWSALAVRANRS